LELSEFEISYHPRVALKSQILADFIVEYSGQEHNLEEQWVLYVNSAYSQQGSGAGVAVISPQDDVLNYALHLMFPVINNVAEYEAMIVGLKLVKELGAREVRLYSDSQLAVRQINEEIRVLDDNLLKYKDQLSRLKEHFSRIEILHISHGQNSQADALSKLAASGNLDKDCPIIVMEISRPSIEVLVFEILHVEEVSTRFTPIWDV
jgi:ribonuclease HI